MREFINIIIILTTVSFFMYSSGCISSESTSTSTTLSTIPSTVRSTLTTLKPECSSDSNCIPQGCSSQVCAVKDPERELVTTCEMRPEYECLSLTECGCVDGKCVWKSNDEYDSCLVVKMEVILDSGSDDNLVNNDLIDNQGGLM